MDSQNTSKVTLKAQEILNTFMDEMESIDISHQYSTSRPICFRDEQEGKFASDEFRELFLQNAIKRNQDAIITKKGDWV